MTPLYFNAEPPPLAAIGASTRCDRNRRAGIYDYHQRCRRRVRVPGPTLATRAGTADSFAIRGSDVSKKPLIPYVVYQRYATVVTRKSQSLCGDVASTQRAVEVFVEFGDDLRQVSSKGLRNNCVALWLLTRCRSLLYLAL